MEIMIGYSGEISSGQWRKCDIKLDETDFNRILAEFDCVGIYCTTTQMFSILELECQRLIAGELIMRSKSPDQKLIDEWRTSIKEYTAKRNDQIMKLKVKAEANG